MSVEKYVSVYGAKLREAVISLHLGAVAITFIFFGHFLCSLLKNNSDLSVDDEILTHILQLKQ